jgi:hypothetical protein
MQNQEPYLKPENAEQPADEGLDGTACSAFLILWHGVDEWEWIKGDLCHAHEEATIDRSHLNYGRKGYSIIPCPSRPVALQQTPEDALLDSIFGQNSQADQP